MPVARAIVIGGFVNGLGLVRALAARAIPVVVITTQPYDLAHHSRWCVEHHHIDDLAHHPERLIELLQEQQTAWAGSALFPTTDEALAALASDYDRLSSHYRVVAAPVEVIRPFLDKRIMNGVARAVGVPCPTDYGPAQAVDVESHRHFPVVIKPTSGVEFMQRFGAKLFFATDRRQLENAIVRIREAGIDADLMDYVPGADSDVYAYCTYMDGRGEPRAGLTIRKLRQGPPRFGIARVAEVTSESAELREATLEMVRRLRFRGIAVAEFKRDARDGSFRFIEMNGRSVIYNALLRRAGLDLAALAWSDFVDNRPIASSVSHWPGVWIHEHADLFYSALHRRIEAPRLNQFLQPYLRPKQLAVWSAADPLPFCHEWARTVREGLVGVWTGEYRRRLADTTQPPG